MNSEKGRKAHKQGHFAETKAALFLRLKGYRVVERNFKPPRGTGAGEIDLIVKKGNVLVFVEVKLRQTETAAAESMSPLVQERRIKGAEYYLMLHPESADCDIRFDVVLMTPNSLPKHIPNAFMAL